MTLRKCCFSGLRSTANLCVHSSWAPLSCCSRRRHLVHTCPRAHDRYILEQLWEEREHDFEKILFLWVVLHSELVRALELGVNELVDAILQRGGAECETSRAGASATEVQPLRFPTKRSKAVARGLIQSMFKPMANQRGEVCVPTPCLPEIQAVDALGSRHEGRDFKKLAVAPRRSQLIGCLPQAGAGGCCCNRSMSRHCHNCMGNLFSCVFAREALGGASSLIRSI